MEKIPINNLSYEEKQLLYTQLFSTGNFIKNKSVNDKLILISLISLVFLKLKKTKPDVKPLDILLQITKTKKDDSAFYHMLEALSITVEDFCYENESADPCGLKSSEEIINKIKEILNLWLPF